MMGVPEYNSQWGLRRVAWAGRSGVWRWPSDTPLLPMPLLSCCSGKSEGQLSWLLSMANSSPGEASRAGASCSVAMVTVCLLTNAAGDGGPMAPNAQVQKAGPLGWPGLWAGSIYNPCSPGLLRAMLLMRRGSLEVRLSLLGFLPDDWGWVLWSHFSLRALKL